MPPAHLLYFCLKVTILLKSPILDYHQRDLKFWWLFLARECGELYLISTQSDHNFLSHLAHFTDYYLLLVFGQIAAEYA